RRETGVREAVTSGVCKIGGQRAVLIVFDFAFLGGTMGSVVGEKIAHAFEEATARRIPLVSVTASGGARVQEGMFSLMQMAKVAVAASRHDRQGLANIVVLTDPTFGGVAASFASLGDILIAEPGAEIGFVGPRVIDMTLHEPQPPDSHRAESLFRAGMVDLVIGRPQLRATVSFLIGHLSRPSARRRRLGSRRAGGIRQTPVSSPPAPWDTVQLARLAGRPTSLDYITRLFTRLVELHGDRQFGDDPAIVGVLGELRGRTVVVVGQERGRTDEEQAQRRHGRPFPEGYRKALRLMRLAAKFGLPVVTFIDTPGAYPGYQAEQRGIAPALAHNLQAMVSLPTPIVSVVIGEGGSGGALALGVA